MNTLPRTTPAAGPDADVSPPSASAKPASQVTADSTAETSSEDRLADLRLRLHDYMLGFADANADRMQVLHSAHWAGAARIEQLRRHPLVTVLDDELLDAVATGAIDPNAEACYLIARLREVDAEAAEERAAHLTAAAATNAGVGGQASPAAAAATAGPPPSQAAPVSTSGEQIAGEQRLDLLEALLIREYSRLREFDPARLVDLIVALVGSRSAGG